MPRINISVSKEQLEWLKSSNLSPSKLFQEILNEYIKQYPEPSIKISEHLIDKYKFLLR